MKSVPPRWTEKRVLQLCCLLSPGDHFSPLQKTLPTIFKLLELKLYNLTRCPEGRVHRQGSWNDWLEVRFGIPSGLQILFYFIMHSTFQWKKTRSGKDMSAVSSLMQLGMQGWGGLRSNPPSKVAVNFLSLACPCSREGGEDSAQ